MQINITYSYDIEDLSPTYLYQRDERIIWIVRGLSSI